MPHCTSSHAWLPFPMSRHIRRWTLARDASTWGQLSESDSPACMKQFGCPMGHKHFDLILNLSLPTEPRGHGTLWHAGVLSGHSMLKFFTLRSSSPQQPPQSTNVSPQGLKFISNFRVSLACAQHICTAGLMSMLPSIEIHRRGLVRTCTIADVLRCLRPSS